MANGETVQSNEELLRGILDAATEESIWVFDRDGTVLFANAKALDTVGRGADEIIGRRADLFVPAEVHQPRLAMIRQVFDTALPLKFEDQRGGVDFHHRLSPVRDDQGRVTSVASFSRDVTLRRRTEARLRESEENSGRLVQDLARQAVELETVLDSIDGAVFVFDAGGRAVRTNAATRELYGFDIQDNGSEAAAATLNIRHLDGRMMEPHEFPSRRALRGESVKGALYFYRAPDGTDHIGEASANPLFIDGKIIGAVIVVHDVTERVHAVDDLRQGRELYRAIASNLPDGGVVVVNRELRYVVADGPLWSRMGWRSEEMVGRTIIEAIGPEVGNTAQPRFIRALSGETATYETKYGEILVRANYQPLRDARGQVYAVMVLALDVTERKRVEEDLRQAVERFRIMGEILPYGVWLSDAEGKSQYVSESFLELLNLSLEEQQGFGWTNRLVPEDVPGMLERWLDCVRTGKEWDSEHRIVDRYGEIKTVLTRGRPVRDDQGRITAWAGVNLDITERKRVEEARREAEEALKRAHDELEQRVAERTAQLEMTVKDLHEKEHMLIFQSRLAAMGEMISNIAHQWRQPLNSLGLVIQRLALLQEFNELNEEVLDQSVKQAMNLIRHMSGTIDDFRNFFKPEKEKVKFKVYDVVTGAVKLVEETFRSREIKIVVDKKEDPYVFGYPSEYSQVILNMLANAKDAFEVHRTDQAEVRITVTAEKEKTLVTVTDNAGGIPAEIISKVFDPHFTTKETHGTGIGLFMSKVIIEKNMNGRIEVRNTGTGAEFCIEV